MMKSYTAYCMNEDGENMCMTREYNSKKDFINDLHGNGYKVHFVALTDKYDEESEKYNARRIQKNREAKIRRETKRAWAKRSAEIRAEIEARYAAEEATTAEETEEEPKTEEPKDEQTATEKPAENETDSAFITEMFAALDYFKRVLWSYTEAECCTRSERDISGDFWGAHECSVILSFVNVLLKAQGAEPYYKLKNDFDDLTECFEEIMQKFEYGDDRTIEEIISEYNFS